MSITRRRFLITIAAGAAVSAVSLKSPSRVMLRERWEGGAGKDGFALSKCQYTYPSDSTNAASMHKAFLADGMRLVSREAQ